MSVLIGRRLPGRIAAADRTAIVSSDSPSAGDRATTAEAGLGELRNVAEAAGLPRPEGEAEMLVVRWHAWGDVPEKHLKILVGDAG